MRHRRPHITLVNGSPLPLLGLGVFKVPPEQTQRVVTDAIAVGYRSFDTASRYGNEAGVGAAIADSAVPRDEVFVTTKLGNPDQGYASTFRAFDASASRLGLDVIDLYLIHWPAPARKEFENTWRAMTELWRAGRTRFIGVSNFLPHHLSQLLRSSDVVPSVNQIEIHPYLQQEALRAFNARHGIATAAYSPLGRGRVLNDPVIRRIASRVERTPAQVVLRWHLQLGNIVIPKSSDPARLSDNFHVFDFELSQSDMDEIRGLDRAQRFGFHPDRFNGFPTDFTDAAPPL
jgi:2,5-diketo-D-gluconate reductase A